MLTSLAHPVGKPEEITYHLNDLLGTTLATVGQPLKSNSSGGTLSTDAPSSPTNPVPANHQLPPTRR